MLKTQDPTTPVAVDTSEVKTDASLNTRETAPTRPYTDAERETAGKLLGILKLKQAGLYDNVNLAGEFADFSSRKDLVAQLLAEKLSIAKAIEMVDSFNPLRGHPWTRVQKIYLGLWLHRASFAGPGGKTTKIADLKSYPSSKLCCHLMAEQFTTHAKLDSLFGLLLVTFLSLYTQDTFSEDTAQACRAIIAKDNGQLAEEARQHLRSIPSNLPASQAELHYHKFLGLRSLQDLLNLKHLAKSYPNKVLCYLIDDPLLSDLEKIEYFYQLVLVHTSDAALNLTGSQLANLGANYLRVLKGWTAAKPPTTFDATALLIFFQRQHFVSIDFTKDSASATETEVKGTETFSTTSLCVQMAETIIANPALWKILYTIDSSGQIPVHTAHHEIATVMLRIAPFTQTHAKDDQNKRAIDDNQPRSALHTLLQTHEKRADLVDLRVYMEQVLIENKGHMRDRKLIRGLAYLEITRALTRGTDSKNEVLCRAELDHILQTKIAAEKTLTSSGWRGVLGINKDTSTFLEILEGLRANLTNLLPQYQQHQATFQAHLASIQSHIAKLNGGELPAEKSDAEIITSILTEFYMAFIKDKQLQLTDEQRPAKELFYQEVAAGRYDLDANLGLLHPKILAELYQIDDVRKRLPQWIWHVWAFKEGYAELAQACFTQVMQAMNSPAPTPSQSGPATVASEVKATDLITPDTLFNLAAATPKPSIAVKACLQKLNYPNDRSPQALPMTIRCYQFLCAQPDTSKEEGASYHYQLALVCVNAHFLADKALDLSPESLATAITQRLLAIPRGPNVLISDIQTELEQDPGYQALCRRIDKGPRWFSVHYQLYQLYKNLALHELASKTYDELFKDYGLSFPEDYERNGLDNIERAMLYEKAHPLEAVTQWERPLPSSAQPATETKTEVQDYLLPALPASTLQSKAFQERTLAMLARLSQTPYRPGDQQLQKTCTIAVDRINALLSPFTKDFTSPVSNPEARTLCQQILSIPGIEKVLPLQPYKLFLFQSATEPSPDGNFYLAKLLRQGVFTEQELDALTPEELAVLNDETVAKMLLAHNNHKLKISQLITSVERCLFTQSNAWTRPRKLAMGLWLKQSTLESLSWSYIDLGSAMFLQTLVDGAQEKLPIATLWANLDGVHRFFSSSATDKSIALCRKVMMSSTEFLQAARERFQRLSYSESDTAFNYQLALGLAETYITGTKDYTKEAIAHNSISGFIHYEASLKPVSGSVPKVDVEQKRPNEISPAKALPLSVQLVEAMLAKSGPPSGYIYLPDQLGFIPLHAAIETKSPDVMIALLRFAPYRQTHMKVGDKMPRELTSETSLQEILATYEKRADLWDLLIYREEVFVNPLSMLGDRKQLRIDACVNIFTALEGYAHSKDPVVGRAELTSVLQQCIAAEQQIADSGFRRLVSNKSTFVEILEGLCANLDNVLAQYLQYQTLLLNICEGSRSLESAIRAMKALPKPIAASQERALAPFLRNKDLQVSDAQKPVRALVLHMIRKEELTEAQLHQLHPDILLEIYADKGLRGKIRLEVWTQLAWYRSNEPLISLCVLELIEEVERDHPAPQDLMTKLLDPALIDKTPLKNWGPITLQEFIVEALLVKRSGQKLAPSKAIQYADECLGRYGINWTRLDKIRLGLWLNSSGYPEVSQKPDGCKINRRGKILPFSWAMSRLCCHLLQRVLSEGASQDQTIVFNRLDDIWSALNDVPQQQLLNDKPTELAVKLCRRVIAEKGELASEASSYLKSIDRTQVRLVAIHYQIAMALQDESIFTDRIDYWRGPNQILSYLLEDSMLSDQAKLAKFAALQSYFTSMEPIPAALMTKLGQLYLGFLQVKPEAAQSPSAVPSSPTKTAETKSADGVTSQMSSGPTVNLVNFFISYKGEQDTTVKPVPGAEVKSASLGVQIVEAIVANPAYWSYLYRPGSEGKLPLGEVIFKAQDTDVLRVLLAHAPYTQLNKTNNDTRSFGRGLLGLGKGQQLADLLDLKIYTDQTFAKIALHDERKRVRGEAYLEIMAVLAQVTDLNNGDWKEQIKQIVKDKLAEDDKITADKWNPLSGKDPAFAEILQGLQSNFDKLLLQYRQFGATFRALGEAIEPSVKTWQANSALVNNREAVKQAGFSLGTSRHYVPAAQPPAQAGGNLKLGKELN